MLSKLLCFLRLHKFTPNNDFNRMEGSVVYSTICARCGVVRFHEQPSHIFWNGPVTAGKSYPKGSHTITGKSTDHVCDGLGCFCQSKTFDGFDHEHH